MYKFKLKLMAFTSTKLVLRLKKRRGKKKKKRQLTQKRYFCEHLHLNNKLTARKNEFKHKVGAISFVIEPWLSFSQITQTTNVTPQREQNHGYPRGPSHLHKAPLKGQQCIIGKKVQKKSKMTPQGKEWMRMLASRGDLTNQNEGNGFKC